MPSPVHYADEANGGINSRIEYYHTDHLGNVRLTFSDLNGDNAITTGDIYSPLNEVAMEQHYYPFGMSHIGTWYATIAPDNKYRYNGKELDEATGLYDYGARYYDPAIARWGQVDPLADQYAAYSPYNYVIGNPIKLIDPDGMRVEGDYYNKKGEFIASDNIDDDKVYVQDENGSTTFGNGVVKGGNKFSELPIGLKEFNMAAGVLYSEMGYLNPDATEAATIYDVLQNRLNTPYGKGLTFEESLVVGKVDGFWGRSYRAAMARRSLDPVTGYSKSKHNKAREGLIMGLTSPIDHSGGSYFWEGTHHFSDPDNYYNRVGHGTTARSKTGIITYLHIKVVGATTFMKYNPATYPNKTWP